MATQGPNAGGTFVTTGASFAWINPSNAAVSDNVYTTQTTSAVSAQSLQCTNFGFSIPAGATINGITVGIERKSSNATNPGCSDQTIQLMKAGSVTGSNKASGTNWPTTEATLSYGGVADLWGTTWTDAQINASGFGISINAVKTGLGKSSVTASIDFVSITITYTATSSVNSGFFAFI